MSETLQQLDLSHSRNRETILLRLHPDPLERDESSRLDVLGLVHFPVRPFADLDDALVQLEGSWNKSGGRRCSGYDDDVLDNRDRLRSALSLISSRVVPRERGGLATR